MLDGSSAEPKEFVPRMVPLMRRPLGFLPQATSRKSQVVFPAAFVDADLASNYTVP